MTALRSCRRRSFLACAAWITGFCLLSLVSLAQDSTTTRTKDQRPLKDRIWFGGGLGLIFGTVTAIQAEPMVGYFLDKKNKLSVGTGLSYWYLRDNRLPAARNDGYGYRLFTRFRPIQQFFAHVEFLHLNAQPRSFLDQDIRRIWVPHVLLGGGYVQPLGGRSSIFFQVLFDALQDPNSVYGTQPIISGGIGVGF